MEKPDKIYVDTNCILDWFVRMLRDEKKEEPELIEFIREHQEIQYFTSLFTIAEITEHILYKKEGERIKQYKKNIETIKAMSNGLKEALGLRIIEDEMGGETPLSFTDPDVIQVTKVMHSAKDAVHFCIAKHNKLTFVSHEDRFGELKEYYPDASIMTVNKLIKTFE